MNRFPILAALTLSACAPLEPYTQAPTHDHVCVRVNWTSAEHIQSACRGGDVIACATIPPAAMREPYAQIWAEKPRDFGDRDRVCSLGHEFFHTLGANHQRSPQ